MRSLLTALLLISPLAHASVTRSAADVTDLRVVRGFSPVRLATSA